MRSALIAAAAIAAGCLASSEAKAQYVYVAGYAPAYVAPAPTVVYRPVQPVVAYSPVVSYPAPVVYSRPIVRTRFRPILGGTVTRVRYSPVWAY